MGRGPTDVRAHIIHDIILVRLKGVLTPAERQLAKSPDGVGMVKQMRENLIGQGRDKLCKEIGEITGVPRPQPCSRISMRELENVLLCLLSIKTWNPISDSRTLTCLFVVLIVLGEA